MNQTASTRSSPFRWQSLAALILLLVLFTQLLSAATQLSITIDEGFHITSGYEYLRTGRMRLMDEHVPLAKALFAWPLFFVPDLTPPEQAMGWAEGDLIRVAQETVLAYQPIDRIVVACRIPVTLVTLILAATVYRWAADWFGPTAGVFALALLVFDPNILAHGSLATTDMGMTGFVFFAVWAFVRYLKAPTRWRRWGGAAVLLGLAQGAKLTALLLLPVLGVLAMVDAWIQSRGDRARALLRRGLAYGGMVVVTGLVLWAVYLFEVRPLSDVANGMWSLPAASHVERWLRLQTNLAYGREAFLLGQNRMHGWWQYFPIAFALKTPLPTLLFAMVSIGLLIFGRRRRIGDELALALFPLTYGALSLTSSINIGYRHLLPILPFLFIFTSRIANGESHIVSSSSRLTSHVSRIVHYALRIACYVLLSCYLITTLLLSPHYLAYFNSIAGGPDEGYRFLADSNTDWGQSLRALADYQRQNDEGPVRLSLFTFLDPATYSVRYEPIAPMSGALPVLPRRFSPEPGLYAISATTLDGVPLPLPSMYNWFWHRAPSAKIGHVMLLYEVEENQGAWVAQCTVPVVPLTGQALAEGFGSPSLRQIYFDCEQSWIFPDGGISTGWYAQATPGIDRLRWPVDTEHLEWWPAWVQQMDLEALRLSYVQPTPSDLPAFAVWEWSGLQVRPSLAAGEATFDEALTFLGYAAPDAAQPDSTVDVLTYWRILAQPSRPLSLMLHLVNADRFPIAVGDGLGISVDQWQRGDMIVQRHRLAIPADAPLGTYQVRSGAYWLDDMHRLTSSGSTDILLTSIEIGH